MTPRQQYLALVRQGYSPERAAQRSGWAPRTAPATGLRATETPEPAQQVSADPPPPPVDPGPAQGRPTPTETQRAWKRGGLPSDAQRAWNGQRPTSRPAAPGVTVPYTRVELPDVRPPAVAAPMPPRRERPQLTLVPAVDLSWQDEALCAQVDTEIFFPEKGGSTKDAKRVCMACPVRQECLDYALDRDERFGVFGGLSEPQRRRLKKTRGGAA